MHANAEWDSRKECVRTTYTISDRVRNSRWEEGVDGIGTENG
jgi:hypothetical protein